MISPTYEYDAVIKRWVDGDTCQVDISLGFHLTISERVRVYGLNCREIHASDKPEKALGISDLEMAISIAPLGGKIKLRSHKDGTEKFGRFLAEIELPDGRDFAKFMIDSGHGAPYFGGPRTT